MIDDLESVATDLLAELGLPEEPLDAFELARDCGFDVVGGGAGAEARVMGDRIIQVDAAQPVHVQKTAVACAVGRWALYRAGLEPNPQAADYVGLALVLPRAALVAELRETLDLRALRLRHECVSLGALVRRVSCVLEGELEGVLDRALVSTREPGPDPTVLASA